MLNETELTRLFVREFQDDSGMVRTCVCKRTHFAGDSCRHYYDDPAELAELQRKAGELPDAYIEHDEGPCTFTLFGRMYVVGCPCGADRKSAKALLDETHAVTNFYTAVAMAEEAQILAMAASIRATVDAQHAAKAAESSTTCTQCTEKAETSEAIPEDDDEPCDYGAGWCGRVARKYHIKGAQGRTGAEVVSSFLCTIASFALIVAVASVWAFCKGCSN